MTTQEYQAYQQSVARFLTRNYVKPGCHSPLTPDEPFFSRSACECCGSRFAGERETYVFAYEANGPGRLGRQDKGGHTFEANICTDCVSFLANGKLDDLTMLDMDR